MNIKYNINKIHGDLLMKFPGCEIKLDEKSSLKYGNYFEISILNESKKLRLIITKKELENEYNLNWMYLDNPLNDNSNVVERFSNINNISNDINDIFEKNRFDTEYLNKIK